MRTVLKLSSMIVKLQVRFFLHSRSSENIRAEKSTCNLIRSPTIYRFLKICLSLVMITSVAIGKIQTNNLLSDGEPSTFIIYLHPDGMMKDVPYTEEYDQDIYVNNYVIEWEYTLSVDTLGNVFVVNLIGGSQGLDGTTFSAELFLKTDLEETSLASETFFGQCFYTLPFYNIKPRQMTVEMTGIQTAVQPGDKLLLRVRVVSGAAGRIMYGTNVGTNHIQVFGPISTPLLNSPANGTMNISINPQLIWIESSGAASYWLQVSKQSDFSTIVFSDSNLVATSQRIGPLEYHVNYYWRVRAKNITGSSPWSEVWNFTTLDLSPPAVPSLTLPNDGAIDQAVSLVLDWRNVTGASSYWLQLSTSPDFTSYVFDDSTITVSSKQIGELDYYNKYYWRVRAKNSAGSSPWSEIWSFTTVPALSVPIMESPENGSLDQPPILSLIWTRVNTAASYRLQVSTSSDFTLNIIDETTTKRMQRIEGLSILTQYYWRVRAINLDGLSHWSETWNFTTNSLTIQSIEGIYSFNDVAFTDEYTGIVVGGGGAIYRTTDGGETWIIQSSGIYYAELFGVFFTDANTGTVVGNDNYQYEGAILRTTDGGKTWITQHSGISADLFGVSFTDANTGTVVGNGGAILRTTNGGETWTSQSSGTTHYLDDVSFTDENKGTAVGENGTILRTTDGGETWTSQSSGTANHLWGVFFTDSNTGTVVGQNGTILRTIDGGETWTSQSSGMTTDFTDVAFRNANTGTVVAVSGTILRTTDGGETWVNLLTGSPESLHGVDFIDDYDIIAVGGRGSIYRTYERGFVSVDMGRRSENPSIPALHQNYPNPFNQATNISFDIPARSFVSLKVIDIIGREVAIILSEELSAGNYLRQWDAICIPSGEYFYRLQAGEFTDIRKLILLK